MDLGIARPIDMGLEGPLLLGEGAFWDTENQRLIFVDIKGRKILSWKPGHDAVAIVTEEDCGFAVPSPRGGYIAGVGHKLCRISADGKCEALASMEGVGSIRINDGTISPDGTIWFGTMDDEERRPLGQFWSWRSDRGLRRNDAAFVVSNGPAFTADGSTAYLTDTVRRIIYRASAHEDRLGKFEQFLRFPESWGYPDGMTLDYEDHLWVAHWDGYRVTRFNPQGIAVAAVRVPTARPTKPTFGNANRQTLFITSASIGLDVSCDFLAGRVFQIDVPLGDPTMSVC